MRTFNQLLLALSLVLILSSCSKENYIYLQRQGIHTDQEFRVKEMKGSNAVDIVWVIDNSGSMDTYQQQVIDNANVFMQDFIKQQLNWKMGVISTDDSDSPYAGFKGSIQLDSTISNPVGVFTQAVNRLGTFGSGSEKTFTPILRALQNDSTFSRPNTPIAFIMVTDAEEQSGLQASRFLTQLAPLIQNKNMFAYGVYASNDLGCSSDEGSWNYKNSPYETFINSAMVGQTFPLCNDFGTSLVNIAHDIVTRVAHTAIYLSSRPDTTTLQVLYQGQPLPAGTVEEGGFWNYDYRLNAIVFNNLDFAKNETDSVKVIYEEQI